MKSHWLTYQGNRILYCDYTGFGFRDLEALKAELDAVSQVVTREPERSVLALADVRRSVASLDAVEAVKQQAAVNARHVRRLAVIGVTGLKSILYNAVMLVANQPARAFGDSEVEEAKQWLVEED